MQIVKDETHSEKFILLPPGSVFEHNENFYIKAINDDGDEFAIDLECGEICEFYPEKYVVPYKATLHLNT